MRFVVYVSINNLDTVLKGRVFVASLNRLKDTDFQLLVHPNNMQPLPLDSQLVTIVAGAELF